MADKYTADELNKLGQKELVGLVLSMQDQVSRLNTNLETLIEAVRAAREGKPFFLWYPTTLPHAELLVPEDSLMQAFRGRYPETPFAALLSKYPRKG